MVTGMEVLCCEIWGRLEFWHLREMEGDLLGKAPALGVWEGEGGGVCGDKNP